MSLDDKVDVLELGILRLFGILQHIPSVRFTAEAACNAFKEDAEAVDSEMEWDEIECRPVAWMVCGYGGEPHSVYLCHEEAVARAEGDRIVPLYRLDEGLDEEGGDDA